MLITYSICELHKKRLMMDARIIAPKPIKRIGPHLRISILVLYPISAKIKNKRDVLKKALLIVPIWYATKIPLSQNHSNIHRMTTKVESFSYDIVFRRRDIQIISPNPHNVPTRNKGIIVPAESIPCAINHCKPNETPNAKSNWTPIHTKDWEMRCCWVSSSATVVEVVHSITRCLRFLSQNIK